MKRIPIIAAATLLAVACSQKTKQETLVLYYSQTGNTETVAETIQGFLGADIEAVIPVVPYDGDYAATIERGRTELTEGNFPEIQPLASDISRYDVVFIGYPIWFGTYAPPIETLLENIDLEGKKVVPFCTFGSGGLDSSTRALKEKLTGSEVLPGYGVRAARIDAVQEEVKRFLMEYGFLEGEFTALPEFSASRPVTEEESALFDAAVGDYPMIKAVAEEVASRAVPDGQEYIFTARDIPAGPEFADRAGKIQVYVLAEDGKTPVFTKVCR